MKLMQGSARRRRAPVGIAIAIACLGLGAAVSHANHIDPGLDVNTLRTTMSGEGYLAFAKNTNVHPVGSERTGWTDIRHPAYDGTNINTTNTSIGYDRSDRWIQVHNKILTIDDAAGNQVTAAPSIARDLDYANAAYAHIGLSVFSTGQQSVDFSTGNAAGNPVIVDPVDAADRNTIQAQDRAGGLVVDNWYAPKGNATETLRGVARAPSNFPATSGFMTFNSAVNDTWPHELGHVLLDDDEFNNADSGHSPINTDLMAAGDIRLVPTNAQKGSGNTAPAQPGPGNGTLGGRNLFGANVDTAGNNVFTQDQANSITGSANTQTASPAIRESQNGDRADFDWVEDNLALETIGGNVDNHAGGDTMVFQIGGTFISSHVSTATQANGDSILHDHGNWGELDLPHFDDAFFKVVDVVSQIARYTDMDVADDGTWSPRESALDYNLDFSVDGQNWQPGDVQTVFIKGWTEASDAENYIARWTTDLEAKFIRIWASTVSGHDGNTQIDAVIAAVPEPATVALFAVAALALGARRHRPRNEKPLAA